MSRSAAENSSPAFDAALSKLLAEVRQACAEPRDWREKVAAGIRAGLGFAAREPDAARLLTVDVLFEGERGARCFDQLMDSLAAALRGAAGDGLAAFPLSERTLVAGVVGLVRTKVSEGRTAELPAIAPDAIHFVLNPYVGPEQAIRIAGLAQVG